MLKWLLVIVILALVGCAASAAPLPVTVEPTPEDEREQRRREKYPWLYETPVVGQVVKPGSVDVGPVGDGRIEALEALVTPRTRAIVVINPNNPTGAVYSRDCLTELAELADRHDLVMLSDEIYDQMV